MSYLDWNASTPLHPDVREAMLEALSEFSGNPSSAHADGRRGRAAIERARAAVAALIEAEPGEMVFTSGGSEANNLAIQGVLARRPGHVVTTTIEHPSVADCVARLVSRAPGEAAESAPGAALRPTGLTRVNPRPDGAVDAADVARALRAGTTLVTVMRAQNETGVLQPVAEIAGRVRAAGGGALIHTDAVQAAGKTPVSVRELGVDLLSLSAHKMRGPKGTGALFVRHGVAIEPLIHGGGHERGLRGGTENVAGIVGMGRAAEIAARELPANLRRAQELRDRFESRLAAAVPGVIIHGRTAPRLTNTSCISIPGARGHALMTRLDELGIAVSTGAACHAGDDQGSAVLAAMGVPPDAARGALRVSFGPVNTGDEVDAAVDAVAGAIGEGRG